MAVAVPGAAPVPQHLVESYRRAGLTTDATMTEVVARLGIRSPDRIALTQDIHSFTLRELRSMVDGLGGFLQEQGIGPGDVVTWQLPNWWEAYVAALAIWRIGAISNPIVPIYREHELRTMLPIVAPAAVLTTGELRGFNHADAISQVLEETGVNVRARVIFRPSTAVPGWVPFDETLNKRAKASTPDLDADDPCLALFTSGTTSSAKVVIHSSRSFLAETWQIARDWGLNWEDVAYMPAPLAHITGVIMGLSIPAVTGGRCVLADGWDPERAVTVMMQEGVTYTAGATVFLKELTEALGGRTLGAIRIYGCGGAPVPREVMEASEEHGIPAVRIYGMTEMPSASLGNRAVPFETRASTDGVIAEGVEAMAVEGGRPLANGSEGELYLRGPERMLGYLAEEDNRQALTEDGWFRTGDVGVVSDEGTVTITGRIKDVINRGGEKFATRDIEERLASHPQVKQVAVVPAPHSRFGEVPAAFVVAVGELTAQDLVDHLAEGGMARQKVPVHWRLVPELPMTPSGKVKKFELIAELDLDRSV